MAISERFIQELQERVDIEEVISSAAAGQDPCGSVSVS